MAECGATFEETAKELLDYAPTDDRIESVEDEHTGGNCHSVLVKFVGQTEGIVVLFGDAENGPLCFGDSPEFWHAEVYVDGEAIYGTPDATEDDANIFDSVEAVVEDVFHFLSGRGELGQTPATVGDILAGLARYATMVNSNDSEDFPARMNVATDVDGEARCECYDEVFAVLRDNDRKVPRWADSDELFERIDPFFDAYIADLRRELGLEARTPVR